MSYKATITTETSDMQADLGDLRTSLSKVNWLMRVLGVPPDQRQAFVEMQKMIRTLNTLRMILSVTSIAGTATGVLRLAGLGRYGQIIRNAKWVISR
jgi:hypothetical protein